MNRFFGAVTSVIVVLSLAACSGSSRQRADAERDPDSFDPQNAGGGLQGDLNTDRITDLFDANGGIDFGGDSLTSVNRYLWRASLDTLGFLPLSSTDPFTGVIATDWAATPGAPNERFKVAAYVKSPVLTASSLQVALFREIRDPAGAWVTAPVSVATARQLEDAILVRARQLKIADREAG